MSKTLKPRKTGLIVFTARLISVFTGFLFLVMMTRSLSPTQFGLWEFLTDVVLFSTFPVGLFTYWATREVARGGLIGRTTQALCMAMSLAGVVLYVLFSYGTYSVVHSTITPFLTALILVPLVYWSLATQALVLGHNPAIGAYSLMVSEPSKLVAAYLLLYVYKVGITGVILAIAVSYFVQAGCNTLQLRDIRTDSIDLGKAKEWLKDYHVPALYTLTYVLSIADTFVASVSQGGTALAGYYQAAFQVATIVSYATFLSVALYPLLLRGSAERLPEKLLEFSLMFGLPMAAGEIALAPKILYLLKPTYVDSADALVFLSLAALVGLVSSVFDQTLMGKDTADLGVEGRGKRMMGSDQMFVSAANTAYFACYLTSVFVLARLSIGDSSHVYQFAEYWGASQFLLTVALVIAKVRRVRQRTALKLSASPLFYALSSVIMGVALMAIAQNLFPTTLGTVDYGLRLLLTVVVGAALYFGVLALLDARFRSVARTAIRMVGRLGGSESSPPSPSK